MLDVDTGIDDALALLYATASPALDLCGVTVVAGNVPVDVATRNTTAVLSHVGADHVPVAIGADRTTSGSGPREGRTDHGADGLGGVRVPRGAAPPQHGPRPLLRSVTSDGPVTLVGLAPLTNLAALTPMVDDVVLVGGELVVGQPAEFNAGHDAGATARTLATGRPLTLYVADVFERVSVRPEDVARLRSSSRAAAQLAGELLAVRPGHLIGDAGALVLLTHPGLFRVEPRHMGMVGDHLTETPEGRWADVVVDVDHERAARAVVDTLLSSSVLP